MTLAPRYISSMTREVLTSRRRTLLAARMPAYLSPRCIWGCTADRRVRRAWKRSLRNSPRNRVNDRRYPLGLKKKLKNALLSPRPWDSSFNALVVRYARVASPFIRLQMLTPRFERSPSPFDSRWTISAASFGLLDTMSFWRSRSYHLKAGMPSFVPCRIPAWLADVIDGRMASQRDSLWLPERIQLPIVLTDPARTRPARIGCARPSIWTITRPGESMLATSPFIIRL